MRRFATHIRPWWRLAIAALNRQTIFEFTTYAGSNTTVISEEAEVRGTVSVEHDGRPGVVVGKIYRQLGKPPKLQRDPTMQHRLGLLLEHIPAEQVTDWPETGDIGDGSVERIVVFVHGTLSCGLAHIHALAHCIPADPRLRALRYEHDTFLPVDVNAKDLANEILPVTSPQARIVLVGHSRGGLVARAAAGSLAHTGGERRVGICTLGTPHRGTPIVQAGHRVLSGLATVATAGVGALHPPKLAAFPLKYLFGRLKKLPPGILDMREPGPAYLDLHRPASCCPSAVVTWRDRSRPVGDADPEPGRPWSVPDGRRGVRAQRSGCVGRIGNCRRRRLDDGCGMRALRLPDSYRATAGDHRIVPSTRLVTAVSRELDPSPRTWAGS